jgi:hypothetical protein
MKPHLIAAILLFLSCDAFATDSSPVILGKTLAAVELAHRIHTEATQQCNVKRLDKHELLNWSHIEQEMRDLANAQSEPVVTRMLEVGRVLGLVHDVLREDLVFCTLPLDRSAMVASVEKALSSVDDAATDVESSIFDRVATLEWIAKQYKKSPCSQ